VRKRGTVLKALIVLSNFPRHENLKWIEVYRSVPCVRHGNREAAYLFLLLAQRALGKQTIPLSTMATAQENAKTSTESSAYRKRG
jgi:hypothetical protein